MRHAPAASKHRRRALLAATLIASVLYPTRTHAQFGGFPTEPAPSFGWWSSIGVAQMTIRDITDGKSGSLWSFGTKGVWQGRFSIEKSINELLALGVMAGYGSASLKVRPIVPGDITNLPAACDVECPASAKVWVIRLKGRSGGGPGWHTTLEADGGVTMFRDFKTKGDGLPIAAISNATDFSGTFGAGIGWGVRDNMVINLVQDAGIGMHSGTNIPEGSSRFWRNNTLRLALRYRFGGSGSTSPP